MLSHNASPRDVDVHGTHQLTRFGPTNNNSHKTIVTESDHAKVELHIDLKFSILKPGRIKEYNFKSTECQKYFENITNCTSTLSQCFENNKPFLAQTKQWENKLKSIISQSFFKVRTRK